MAVVGSYYSGYDRYVSGLRDCILNVEFEEDRYSECLTYLEYYRLTYALVTHKNLGRCFLHRPHVHLLVYLNANDDSSHFHDALVRCNHSIFATHEVIFSFDSTDTIVPEKLRGGHLFYCTEGFPRVRIYPKEKNFLDEKRELAIPNENNLKLAKDYMDERVSVNITAIHRWYVRESTPVLVLVSDERTLLTVGAALTLSTGGDSKLFTQNLANVYDFTARDETGIKIWYKRSDKRIVDISRAIDDAAYPKSILWLETPERWSRFTSIFDMHSANITLVFVNGSSCAMDPLSLLWYMENFMNERKSD